MHRGAIRRSEGRRSPAAAVLIDSDSDDGDAVAVVARPATAAVPAAPRARTPPAPDEVDAVTAEKLHPTHWVVVVSPDGKLKTYYNTSTLIRIAQTKGRWMQPPHFREAMSDELRREILRIEDRDITVNIPLFRQAAHEAAGTWDEEVDVQGLEVAEHFVLDKRQLYVCPVCFMEARKPLIKEADDQLAEAKAAMEAAQGTPEAEDAQAAFACMASEHARLEWRRCPIEVLSRLDPQYQLPYVVFPNAAVFKAHVRNCHGDMDGDVSDHTLRSMVNAFLADHNQRHFENRTFHRSHETTARYWFAHARFNTMRYNRLRSAIDQYQPADVRTKCVFETGVTYDDGQADVDFVDDDEADDDDDDDGAVGFAAALMKDGGAAGHDDESDSDLSSAASLLRGDGLTAGGHAGGAGGDPRSEADVLRRLERRAKAERILKKHRREVESSSSSSDDSGSSSAESSNSTEASTSSDDDTEDNEDDDDGSPSSSSSVHSSEVGAAAILSRPSQGATAVVAARGPQAFNRMSAYERRKAADIDLYLRNRDADLGGCGEFSPTPRSSMTLVQSTLSEMFGCAPRSPAPPTVRPSSHRHDVVINDDDDDDEGDDPTTRIREEMLKRVRAKEEAARAKSQGMRRPDPPPPPSPLRQASVVAPRVPPPTAAAAQPPPRRSRVLIDDD